LGVVAMEHSIEAVAKVKWIRDEYNLVILSSRYVEPPQLSHMIKTFSLDIWIFIIISIILVTIFLILNKSLMSYRKNNISLTWIERIIFDVSRILLNQGYRYSENANFLFTIWSLISIILISCFSGNIYSSIINKNIITINDLNELIKANITIISPNNSMIYYNVAYNDPNPHIQLLNPRIQFAEDNVSYFFIIGA